MKFNTLTTLGLLLLCAACKIKNEHPSPAPNLSKDLNTYLGQMKPRPNPAPIPEPQLSGDSITTWSAQGGTYCRSAKYKIGPSYEEGFLLNPFTDVLYLGAILDGNSIHDGGYRLVSLPRSGGEISTDLNGVSNASLNITETVKSKVQQGITDLLNQTLDGTSTAQANFEIKDIYAAEQLDMQLGFTYGYAEKLKIMGGFHFNKNEVKSRVLVRFQQIYYTMSYDAKEKPADYFKRGVTPSQVYESVNGTAIAPVYVSNVKYGRLAFYCFESTLSQRALSAYLQAEFSTLKSKGDVKATFNDSSFSNSTTISGTIIGGSGADAVQSINGLEGLKEYILKGGDYSKTSPGAPIAYTLRRISDNGVFSVVNVTEYTANQCYSTTGAIRINGVRHVEGSQADHLRGSISANLGYDDESFSHADAMLWSNSAGPLHVPIQGAEVPLGGGEFKLVYNPSKFDKAYLMVTVSLHNDYNWGDLGADKMSGTTTARVVKVYKVYLKDIVIGNLGADWSPVGAVTGGTWDLVVHTPRVSNIIHNCTGRYNVGNGCKGYADTDMPKEAATLHFNMSIQLNRE